MALTPRLFIGEYNGAYGLKTAFPGFDVLNSADDNNADRRSFNSQWPDTFKVGQLGMVAGVTSVGATVPHSLGYTAYCDARMFGSDPVFYDDAWITVTVTTKQPRVYTATHSGSILIRAQPTANCVYVVWKRPL